MAGVTPEGFQIKTLDEIRTALHQRIADSPELGPHLDVSEHSALGQLTGVMAGLYAELWELASAVFAQMDPDAASDYALTVLASLTGTSRRGATHSTVAVTLNLDAGVTVPAGSRVSVNGRPDLVFEIDEDATNAGVSAANVAATATSINTGPIAVNAGTLTVIDSTIDGWTSVTNALDAAPGRNEDDDIILRQRREDQLRLRGGSTIEAIKADLLDSDEHPELDGIEAVRGLENVQDVADGNGLPPHSFEMIIDDGPTPSVDDEDIAQTIWDTKPAGIATFGDTLAAATDANGDTQPVRFSRRDPLNIYVSYSLTTSAAFPSNGLDLIDALVLEAGRRLNMGDAVIYHYFRSLAFGVPGVTDVPVFYVGTTPGPTGTANVNPTARQRALFDSSRIVHL